MNPNVEKAKTVMRDSPYVEDAEALDAAGLLVTPLHERALEACKGYAKGTASRVGSFVEWAESVRDVGREALGAEKQQIPPGYDISDALADAPDEPTPAERLAEALDKWAINGLFSNPESEYPEHQAVCAALAAYRASKQPKRRYEAEEVVGGYYATPRNWVVKDTGNHNKTITSGLTEARARAVADVLEVVK